MENASTRLEEIISEYITTRRIIEKFSELLEILHIPSINYFYLDLQQHSIFK